jgi:hypothetical protein
MVALTEREWIVLTLAHEGNREQTRQGSTSRGRETTKHLLRRTTVNLRLRGDKDLQRLRA